MGESPTPFGERLLTRCRFPDGDRVTCAVSGGPDSLALLVLAVWNGHDVTAVHVDHGLRAGSADEAAVVDAAARRFGAGFESITVRVGSGPNLEERARDARRAALPPDVLLGHTADDQAETLLLNLMRGAGPSGLAAIRDDRRPMLELRRSETHALCVELGLDPVHDPSNDDPTFLRNRVRVELVPLLCDIVDRDVVPILVRSAMRQREVADLLAELASDVDPTDGRALSLLAPLVAGEAVRGRHREATGLPHPLDHGTVTRVLDVANGRSRAADIGDGWRVERSAGRLRLVAPGSSAGATDG